MKEARYKYLLPFRNSSKNRRSAHFATTTWRTDPKTGRLRKVGKSMGPTLRLRVSPQ